MSRSSEEVLLIVNNVRHKKTDGTMYMMGTRMAWMQESKNSFSISHNYADIKVQKISPDTKPKIQLQVVMHDASADTFQFTNPLGREAQSKDREGVKELLQHLLPKFRVKVNSELEQKNKMLQDDPELFQLYKDLVVGGIVTAEEFWANRVQKDGNAQKKTKQEVGVSAAFLADIKPMTDGCNGLRYNLTADIIESIFRTYPAVKQKHAEYVPEKLTEADFWTKFFQSHYFHRDRLSFHNKDLFADCAKTDDQNILKLTERPLEDPSLDLNKLSDNTLTEGYGVDHERGQKSLNSANACLIKRFNQHSTMVLQSSLRSSSANDESQTNGDSSSSQKTSNSKTSSLEPPHKKARLKEKLEYADLESATKSSSSPMLRLARADRYLHGPTPAQAFSYTTTDDMIQACNAMHQDIASWHPKSRPVMSANTAVSVLSELSPGGVLMKGFSDQQLHQLVGADVEEEVRHTYSALLELLRHFWSCFPTTTPFLEDKVGRMRATLERFHQAKLNPVKERLMQYHYTVNLAGHMEEMLVAAYNKYNTWQTRRMSRK